MPKRSYARKAKRKTAYRKKRKGFRGIMRGKKRMSKPSSLTLRRPTAFPDSIFVKLRYTDLVDIEWDINAIPGLARYSINSPYDPQVSGGGRYNTQPYGYDQWSAIYGSYRCAGSSIRVHSMPTASTTYTNQQVRLTIFPTPISSTSVTDIQMFQQIPYSRTSSTSIYQRSAINHYISVRKLCGISKATFEGDPFYAAGIATDPTNQCYWMISAAPFQEVGPAGAATVKVIITYYVQFFNRKLVSSS